MSPTETHVFALQMRAHHQQDHARTAIPGKQRLARRIAIKIAQKENMR